MEKLLTLVMLASLSTAAMPHAVWAQAFPPRIIERTENGTADAQNRENALKVWNQYVRCLKDRRFKPCFGLLSGNTLQIWRELYGVTTGAQYADVKGSEEVAYTDVQMTTIRRQGPRIIITARAQGVGEGGAFVSEKEFVLVNENGEWRIDEIKEGGIDYLP
jgi:hypothetical protein